MIAFAALLLGSAGAPAPDCIHVADLVTPAMFARYPARRVAAPWRMPDVRRGDAHLFRTAIRTGAVGAPDFAGHYKIVWIGCGAATICPMFVDRKSGHAAFHPSFRSISWTLDQFTGAEEIERITYRRDSRLLVVFGMRNEIERSSGVALYDWRAGQPHLVRFVPAARLCQESAA